MISLKQYLEEAPVRDRLHVDEASSKANPQGDEADVLHGYAPSISDLIDEHPVGKPMARTS